MILYETLNFLDGSHTIKLSKKYTSVLKYGRLGYRCICTYLYIWDVLTYSSNFIEDYNWYIITILIKFLC